MAFDPALYARKSEYVCRKSGPVKGVNSYGLVLCFRYDGDQNVAKFRYGNVRFPYYDPELDRERSHAYDFDVRMTDGTRRLVYVTSERFLQTAREEAQIEAAEAHAQHLGAQFVLVTELDLFGTKPEYMRSLIVYLTERLWEKFPDEPEEAGFEEPLKEAA